MADDTQERRVRTAKVQEVSLSAPVVEQHLVSDLQQAALGLLGCPPEVFAGAVHLQGWNADQTVTLDQAKAAVVSFLALRA